MSSIALISLLNLQLFPTAVRIGVAIWMIPLKSYHSEAISKTSRYGALSQDERNPLLYSTVHAKT